MSPMEMRAHLTAEPRSRSSMAASGLADRWSGRELSEDWRRTRDGAKDASTGLHGELGTRTTSCWTRSCNTKTLVFRNLSTFMTCTPLPFTRLEWQWIRCCPVSVLTEDISDSSMDTHGYLERLSAADLHGTDLRCSPSRSDALASISGCR